MKVTLGRGTLQTAGAIGLVLAVFMSLTACAGGSEKPPLFEGPWAAEFTENYSLAESDFTREVLVDGKVSTQEFSEMFDKFDTCLKDHGITISDYGFDGSYNTSFSSDMTTDESHEATNACSRTSGEDLIGSLYSWTHRNPQHADENKLVTDCLVKSGAVPAGYSSNDYQASLTSDSFPFTDKLQGPKLLEACQVDPLGLERSK